MENGTKQEEIFLDVYKDGNVDEDYGGFPMIDDNRKKFDVVEQITLEQADEAVPVTGLIDYFF